MAPQLAAAGQGRHRAGPPAVAGCAQAIVPSGPGSPEETIRGFRVTAPPQLAPSPNLFCLRRSRPAQTCLLALSCREQIPSRGLRRAGECRSLRGRGPALYSTPALGGSLQPGHPPPTLGSHFSGFLPDIAIVAREPLNLTVKQKVGARVLAMRRGGAGRG